MDGSALRDWCLDAARHCRNRNESEHDGSSRCTRCWNLVAQMARGRRRVEINDGV